MSTNFAVYTRIRTHKVRPRETRSVYVCMLCGFCLCFSCYSLSQTYFYSLDARALVSRSTGEGELLIRTLAHYTVPSRRSSSLPCPSKNQASQTSFYIGHSHTTHLKIHPTTPPPASLDVAFLLAHVYTTLLTVAR